MIREKYVYADLPRTGLCNMLFTWARAALYARDHALQMLAPSWVKIKRIGPWLRGERDKRYYFHQFTNEGYVCGIRKWLVLNLQRNSTVVFRGMGEYFKDINGEHEFLKNELERITDSSILSKVRALPSKFIGVHIRLGDFASIGLALPMDYYLRGIRKARQIAGDDIPVLVFSDGREDELSQISGLGNVVVMKPAPALQDMLSLSKATVLVGTNNSTFSGWAAFLGQMPNIWNVDKKYPVIGFGETLYV